jgi:hypothetical protein
MKLGIMQPYFFPYLGYFQLLHAVDKWMVHDDVQFIKQGWIHRNRILLNGAPHYMTIPLARMSADTRIDQAHLHEPTFEKWKPKLFRLLQSAYRRAPYYDAVQPLVEATLNHDTTSVAEMAMESLRQVCRYLGITTPMVKTSSKAPELVALKGQDKVLALCRQERAQTYINLIGGVSLYDREAFSAQGITLQFLQLNEIHYPQFGEPFVPNLSIVDVLMFNPKERVQELLQEYRLQ